MATKSDKNGDDSSDEVTAEWIVKAQLRITQPKKKAASFGTGDCGARRSTGSPCRVVYKWNSDPTSQDQPTVKVRRRCRDALFGKLGFNKGKFPSVGIGKWIKAAHASAVAEQQ
jgi:hypothetical protein